MFFNSIRVAILCIVIVLVPLSAQRTNMNSSLRSAKITYDISGGGVLTTENNLSIHGIEKFYMKDQGKVQFHTLQLTESIEGNIKDYRVIQYMHKHEGSVMYDVDFDQQVIVKHMNNIPDHVVDISHLEHTGSEVIANYTCEIWENETKKVCLYQNIPLLIEKDYLGFSYRKRAKFALFDLNISDELFLLPDFPIEENALLENNIKTTNLHNARYFYEKILNNADTNVTKKALYHFTEDMVKRQKKNLPMMLQYMKEARACLSIATDQMSANQCMGNLSVVTKNLTNSADLNIGMWTKETQKRIMEYLEENILKLQSHMACIKRVQNIDELSNCMSK